MAAYRLPKATDEEKAARKEAIAEAMVGGPPRCPSQPPRPAWWCSARPREALAHGNPNAASDARTAAAPWPGPASLGAAENVKINLGPSAAASDVNALQVQALLAEGHGRRGAGPAGSGGLPGRLDQRLIGREVELEDALPSRQDFSRALVAAA